MVETTSTGLNSVSRALYNRFLEGAFNTQFRLPELKTIASAEHPPVIVKILRHLGLPSRAPPRSPARRVDHFKRSEQPKNRLPTQAIRYRLHTSRLLSG